MPRVDWCTPHDVLMLIESFDRIALDPCPSPRDVVKAQRRCNLEQGEDGLTAEWQGLAFVNPPYGRPMLSWATKIRDEWRDRQVESISLVPARTDTRWWKVAVEHAAAVCFWRGRITFHCAPMTAPFPSALIYHGERERRFARIFSSVGWIATGVGQ